MRRRLQRLFYIAVAFACILMASFPATAQNSKDAGTSSPGISLGLYPVGGFDGDRFELTIEPGQSSEMTAVMVSFGSEPIRLRSFASHIVPVPNGGMQIPEFGAEPQGTVGWIEFPVEELVLEPEVPIEKIVKVSVPEGTPPGQYVNAIALETLDPIQTEGSPFEQYFRKVVSVYVTVPGDVVVDYSLDEAEVLVNRGQSAIQIVISNDSNTRIDLEGEFVLTAGNGVVVQEGDVMLGPIYMDQTTIMQIPLSSAPPPGDGYQLTYSFTDRNSSVKVSSETIALSVPEDVSTDADAPVQFTNIAIEANADPIVFANVSVDVVIAGSAFRSTRLVMSVSHNGEFVEDFVLADNLALPIGSTTVTQRYLPATDWESGTYTFSLKLETTGSDQQGLVLEQQDVATIEVP